MKTSIFKLFLATLFLGISLTSCEEDREWRNGTLDHELPGITANGPFTTNDVIYLDYISGVHSKNIHGINLRNAQITLSIDGSAGFSYGDQIYLDYITINNQTYSLNYSVRVDSDLVGSKNISFTLDYDYMDFMHNAMLMLLDRGRIDVRVGGSSNMQFGTLYVVLQNDLEVLVD